MDNYFSLQGLEGRRLLTTLVPDVSWGDDGYVDRNATQSFIGVSGTGLLTFGSVYHRTAKVFIGTVNRYDADGTFDRTIARSRTRDNSVNAFADSEGRVLLCVSDNKHTITVARYNTDGSLDTDFGDEGKTTLDTSIAGADVIRSKATTVAFDKDGAIFLAVNYQSDSPLSAGARETDDFDDGDDVDATFESGIFKFDQNGHADKSFANSSRLTAYSLKGGAIESSPDSVLAVQSDGKLLVAVNPEGAYYFHDVGSGTVTRYNVDGSVDTRYGRNGRLGFRGATYTGEFVLDNKDRLLILAGYDNGFGEQFALDLHRYTTGGRPDETFSDDGELEVDFDSASSGTVILQSDGKILLQAEDQLLRLHPDGRTDTSFDGDGSSDVADGLYLAGQLSNGSLLAIKPTYGSQSVTYQVTKLTADSPAAIGRSGTVYLHGTPEKDSYTVRRSGTNEVRIDQPGKPTVRFSDVTAVDASLGDGDDVFTLSLDIPATVNAGEGDDVITTAGAPDVINAEEGDDTIRSGGGFDTVDLGADNNFLDAGTGGGNITTDGYKSGEDIFNEPVLNTVSGIGGPDDVWTYVSYGGRNRLSLTGGTAKVDLSQAVSSVAVIDMQRGAKVIGSDRADTIITGSGDDTIVPGNGNDSVQAGDGDDIVIGEIKKNLISNRFDDRYDLGSGDDVAEDYFGNNVLTGGEGDDTLVTGSGNDSLTGNGGRDLLRGNAGHDTLDGGDGRDRLFGGDDDDLLRGGRNDDSLIGGLGKDSLEGNGGSDLLIGGNVNAANLPTALNVLAGGAGIDRFQLEAEDDTQLSVETAVDLLA